MSSYIIIPAGMKFFDWAAQMMFVAPELNLLYPPQDEKEWRDWATYAAYLNQGQYPLLPIPDKRIYPHDDSWRDWASTFVYLVL